MGTPRNPTSPAEAWAWLSLPPETLIKDCGQARFQGSGPGGQKRNRVYSGVRLTHGPSGLTAECVDSRASGRNVGEALSRLRWRPRLLRRGRETRRLPPRKISAVTPEIRNRA